MNLKEIKLKLKEEWEYNNITCPENGCRCDPICNPKCDKAKPKFEGTNFDVCGTYLDYSCKCKAKWYIRGEARINPLYEDDMTPWIVTGVILGSIVGILLQNI